MKANLCVITSLIMRQYKSNYAQYLVVNFIPFFFSNKKSKNDCL